MEASMEATSWFCLESSFMSIVIEKNYVWLHWSLQWHPLVLTAAKLTSVGGDKREMDRKVEGRKVDDERWSWMVILNDDGWSWMINEDGLSIINDDEWWWRIMSVINDHEWWWLTMNYHDWWWMMVVVLIIIRYQNHDVALSCLFLWLLLHCYC